MTRLHSIGVRVYYEDTDAGGIVYYANYLRFFERARTDWLRAAGITQQELSQLEGLNLVVRECAVQYLRPARLDDLLEIDVGLANPAADIGRASLRFTQQARLVDRAAAEPTAGAKPTAGARPRAGAEPTAGGLPVAGPQTVLATATVRIACIAKRTGRPAPLPERVLLAIAAQVSAKAALPEPSGASAPYSKQNITGVPPDGTAEQE